MENEMIRIGIVGLGYVGLPLAVAFGRKYPTVGFDIDGNRIAALGAGRDSTLEVSREDLFSATGLEFSSEREALASCNIYVITVPTPIDDSKQPDLGPLKAASRTVGSVLKAGDIVVYESTVYPGATEEVCAPILEASSSLVLNKDFAVGYSPERINPGDKVHRLETIVKVTAGSTPDAADKIDDLYASIISAGTHRVSSIRVAEAAKVIENTQRDVNIALVNELAMIFERLGVDTEEVLEAAGTKWNFLPFRPGLVGGHCIGVDPYYLTYKSQQIGYHPEMILAGRRINDNMGLYVAGQVARLMLRRRIHVDGSRILVLGLAFKENCPDVRNSRVMDVVRELESLGATVDITDPWVDPEEAKAAYSVDLVQEPVSGTYDAVVLAVAHDQFRGLGQDGLRIYGRDPHVLYDVKYLLSAEATDGRL